MALIVSTAVQNRPYRSHKIPACTRCRSRKIRCVIDIPGEPCLSCRERRLRCQYVDIPKTPSSSEESGGSKTPKRRRSMNVNCPHKHVSSYTSSVPHRSATTSTPNASIMLAPHLSEDVDYLQRHISQHKTSESEDPQSYQTISHDTRNTIVYLSVPRYRSGLRPEAGPGNGELEIIEQIMGPFKQEVIDLYFHHIHYHFPILDDETCSMIQRGPVEKIPKNLLACVYAIASHFWMHSDTLKIHPRPNSHYVWNKAVAAVLEDFLSPCFATVSSSLLDQIGRPSVSIVGNVTLCGRTVSLTQMFGLHRDPSTWEIADDEKTTRIRLWWGVLITDRWASVAYGGPPHIVKGFYDVPIPTLETLVSPKASPAQKYATKCFLHLCALTEFLGDILSLVHRLKPDPNDFFQEIEQKKKELSDLESRLPHSLPQPGQPGSSNLWFCFLSMRLLLSRVALRAAVLADASVERQRRDELRASSSAVLDFILSLGESQFRDFWLPYATHMLVLSVMISLRCAVEAQFEDDKHAAFSRLQRFMAHIQNAHDMHDWDIAAHCLDKCSEPVNKISSFATRESAPSPEPAAHPAQAANVNVNVPMSSDIQTPAAAMYDPFDPSDFLDFGFSWEAVWDTPSGINFPI